MLPSPAVLPSSETLWFASFSPVVCENVVAAGLCTRRARCPASAAGAPTHCGVAGLGSRRRHMARRGGGGVRREGGRKGGGGAGALAAPPPTALPRAAPAQASRP